MGVKLDFNVLQKIYFQFDKPVEYNIDEEHCLSIYPIMLSDSEIFNASIDVLMIDKDKIPDPDIISMSYLDFLFKNVLTENLFFDKFITIIKLCLHWDNFNIGITDNGSYYIADMDNNIKLTSKKFNDIRRIILYQNIVGYDDEYINPELKAAIEETDALKERGIIPPSLERRMAIMTSHTGIIRRIQMDMTYREHTVVFREICGEVEFIATRAIFLYAGEGDKNEHWIYKKDKSKFDGYIIDRNRFVEKINANPDNIKQISNNDELDNMYNNFNK